MGEVRMDSFEGKSALLLAAMFSHGWADHAEGCATFSDCAKKQAAWEWETGGISGLGPALEHTSARGRYWWKITATEVVAEVRRPAGATIRLTFPKGGDVRTELLEVPGLARHATDAMFLVSALLGRERGERFLRGLLGPRRIAAMEAASKLAEAESLEGLDLENAPGMRAIRELQNERIW